MSYTFEQAIDRYAEVVVKIGLNLQPGQRLLIGSPLHDCLAPLEAAPLVRLVAAHAYRIGVRFVDVIWADQQSKLIRLKHGPDGSLEEYPRWQVNTVMDYVEQGDAILAIFAHDPGALRAADPKRVGILQQTAVKNTSPILEAIARGGTQWTVISVPVPGWAAEVFPTAVAEDQVARLWDLLFSLCRVDEKDPVAAWAAHINELTRRCEYLTRRKLSALRFTGPGTDLTVGLPEGRIWRSARFTSSKGIPYTANMPTEEVFTMPDKDKTEGVVAATRPLSFGGGTVEDFTVTFSGGRVTAISAGEGEGSLRRLIETDEGAGRLGEVPLVPRSSPISRSGLIFHNILFDENAACHIALGNAYKFALTDGERLSDDEFSARGGNLSAIHIDFMIGSGDIDVDGIRDGGASEPLMREGAWLFEV